MRSKAAILKMAMVFVFLLSFMLDGSSLAKVHAEEAIYTFDVKQNDDDSLNVQGLAPDVIGEQVKIIISTGEFVKEGNGLKYVNTTLSETSALVNKKGYFSLVTPPVDRNKVINKEIGITLMNAHGKESGYTTTFPIPVRDRSDLYDKPDWYESYKDDSDLEEEAPAVSRNSEPLWQQTIKNKNKFVAGDRTSYAVDGKGSLWAWGNVPPELTGEKYTSKATQWRLPKKVESIKNVKQITANGAAAGTLTEQGIVWVWGIYEQSETPIKVTEMKGATQIAVDSDGNGLILNKNGTVYKWEISKTSASTGTGKIVKPSVKLTTVKQLSNIEQIHIGYHSLYGDNYMALDKSGAVWAWGDMSIILSSKQQGNVTKKNKDGSESYFHERVDTVTPQKLKDLPAMKEISLLNGRPTFISESFEFWSYIDTDKVFVQIPGKIADGVVGIFKDSPVVLKNNGRFYSWDTGSSSLSSKAYSDLNDMAAITSDSDHYLGIRNDGALMSWGANNSGQLGVSSSMAIPYEPSVIKVPSPVSVAASESHVLALSKNGAVYGWGDNRKNQIKEGSAAEILSPVSLGVFKDVNKLEAGQNFSLLLNKKGELYGWGDLNWLGIKKVTGTPTLIDLVPEPIADIQVYERSVAVLTKNGNVYQLGGVAWNNSGAEQYVHNHYRKIEISDVKAVSMGGFRGYAVKKDGTLWYWKNSIIRGKTQAKVMPGFKNIVDVASAQANGDYLVARDRKDELWAWGDNTARQLSHRVLSQMYNPLKITDKPIQITERELTSVGKNLNVQSMSLSKNGGLLITKNNEMLFFGYTAVVTKSGKLYQNVSFVETADRNMYWIRGEKLWVHGYNNKFGQLGIGVKGYYESPQRVLTPPGFTVK
ncbi:hypothetical protein MNQ98_02530 [Paenibacillus sp. N3/727]|uniref:RCC1 domain-containing protein n=1 Tax=Paenibacillus sp. N3/727 TaxID=2925845 RepID=UPI001F53B947|nr:hypothetical protein [Paenibacillus sp. N3/727]UNK18942.1 hypothetical protein MNQ98_02530 [Paenibacillus sp. N3/727]